MSHYAVPGTPLAGMLPSDVGTFHGFGAPAMPVYGGLLSPVASMLVDRSLWMRYAMGAAPGALLLLAASTQSAAKRKKTQKLAYGAMVVGALGAAYLGNHIDTLEDDMGDLGDYGGTAGKARRLARRLARLQRRLAKTSSKKKSARLGRRIAKISARLAVLQSGAADPAITDASYVDEEDTMLDLYSEEAGGLYPDVAAQMSATSTPSWLLPLAIGGGILLVGGLVLTQRSRGQRAVTA